MKKIKLLILALAVALMVAGAGVAVKAEAPAKPQTVCPVLGGEINKEYFTDYKGNRIYFCCPSCEYTFKKDAEKFLKKMKDEGVTLEKTPAGEKKK
jgi:YHS domain-containing protein